MPALRIGASLACVLRHEVALKADLRELEFAND